MKYVFLLCSERSGSNLITKILDSHPKICGPSPSHLFRMFSQNILNYGDLKNINNWNQLIDDIFEYFSLKLGVWNSELNIDFLKENVKKHTLSEVLKTIYQLEATSHNSQIVFIKENKIYEFLPFILINFPDSKFIYLTRDPRDVALSFKKSSNHPGGIIESVKLWTKDQIEFKKTYGYLIEKEKIIHLKYEELLSNSESEINRLCAFIGVKPTSDMLEFYKNDLTKKNSTKIKNWENLGKPLITNNFNKYKNDLSEIEIRYIENKTTRLMSFLKYTSDFEFKQLTTEEINLLEKEDHSVSSIVISKTEEQLRSKRNQAINKIINRNL